MCGGRVSGLQRPLLWISAAVVVCLFPPIVSVYQKFFGGKSGLAQGNPFRANDSGLFSAPFFRSPPFGPYLQYGCDFPEEIPEKFQKDPGNALR